MSSQVLVDAFLAFREECIWTRHCYNIYVTLYHGEATTRNILNGSASVFFSDLQRILVEYCYLQICKITDPSSTSGRDNLSAKNIDRMLEANGLISDEIMIISLELHRYRMLIVDARNKLISHLDKDAILSQTLLGAHAEEEVALFFNNLAEYNDLVGTVIGVGPLDFRVTSSRGDAIDLISCLKRAISQQ